MWTKGGTDVTTLTEDNSYVVSAGTYGSNSQTTTLTVKAAVNTADSTYTCVITSNEWLISDKETSLTLNVFGKKIIMKRRTGPYDFFNVGPFLHCFIFLTGQYRCISFRSL